MLRTAVQRLAAEPEVQNGYIAAHHLHHDELALELDDVRDATIWMCELSRDQTSALNALDAQLLRMSGHENAHLWTDEGVAEAPEWQIVRRLAKEALRLLNEPPTQSG